MRKVLLASVAVLGLAATPLMAQTTLNSKDSVNTPAGGANVGASGSVNGADMNRNSPSGTTSGTTDRDRDRSLATVPDRGDKNNSQMRDKDNNSARQYAPGQEKKDRY